MKNYCMDAPFFFKFFLDYIDRLLQKNKKGDIKRKPRSCGLKVAAPHYRLDYPGLDDKNWRAWINIYKSDDGRMKFEKQAFDAWAT